jgi:hypothetical protein
MLLSSKVMWAIATTLFVSSALADTICPLLPIDSAPAIEFSLPQGALSNPRLDLSIMFEGMSTPIVTRRPLPFGSTPKIVIERYSSKPTIAYNEDSGSVVISSEGCGLDGGEGSVPTSAAATGQLHFMAAAVSVALGLAHEGIRSYALAAALYSAFGHLVPVAQAAEECSHTVTVVVEAPEAYMGAVETCLAEIDDETVCPLPFPTFETCNDPNPAGGVAVVGAGAGGLYTALR